MAWIRNNTFLAVFLAVMIVGVSALGFLLYSSYGTYQQVAQDYDTQVKELQRLQTKNPFPNQKNLVSYQTVRSDYRTAVEDLQNKLAAFEPPAETPPTPTQFQDKLRGVVDGITKAADANGIAYPTDFYLGFERYRSNLPDPGATLALTNQLNNIQELVGILITHKVDKITQVKRTILPQEGGASTSAPTPTPVGKPIPNQPNAELVSKSSVVFAFTGPPAAFRDSLNDVTSAKRLFVIRAVQVKNQVDKGPERGQMQGITGGFDAAPKAAPAADSPVGSEPLPEKGPPPLRYVLGQEKLDVVMRVELTRVAPRR